MSLEGISTTSGVSSFASTSSASEEIDYLVQ